MSQDVKCEGRCLRLSHGPAESPEPATNLFHQLFISTTFPAAAVSQGFAEPLRFFEYPPYRPSGRRITALRP